MQSNDISKTNQTQSVVLPKATITEINNGFSKQSTYIIDVCEPYIEQIRRKFSHEIAEMVLETCNKLKPLSDKKSRLYLASVDDTKKSYATSSLPIDNPRFFLLTSPNLYCLDSMDYTQVEIKHAEIISANLYNHTSNQLAISAEIGGEDFCMLCHFAEIIKFPNFKATADGNIVIGNFQLKLTPFGLFKLMNAIHYPNECSFLLRYTTVSKLYGANLLNKDELNNLMIRMMTSNLKWSESSSNGSGISKTFTKYIEPYLSDLRKSYPLYYCILKSLIADTTRTLDSVKLSVVFNAAFDGVASLSDLVSRIWPDGWDLDKKGYYYSNELTTSHWYKSQNSYKDARRKALKSQGNRAISKIMEEIESLNLDEAIYPNTYAAITNSEIPISTFFRKSEQYFIFNDNWQLWEEMLDKFPDITKELAACAAARTTYEKDLMSYFYFILYTLPDYLKAQTGEHWTCSPRLVNSESELEPPKDDENGIVRKRSALTPIVDNNNKTVIVPYASLAIAGRQTTYCYSLDYQILKKGFSFKGNVVMNDVESKLNGRDDYGLMFYTLTGSESGRGYPTFLIIFERRESGTYVHFHRTHPSRSKDGDYNPVHNWTRVCYNWMIGNVAKENIIAQQGDLAFVKMENDGQKDFSEFVKAYDNHIFENIVAFSPYLSKTKSNILGYVKVDEPNVLQHHEHEWVQIPTGVYTVYQCRSWECNPKGVWSLRID
jgi:hypothetical protein